MTNPTAGMRVVLVDDAALFRHGLAALLTAAGLTVAAQLDSAAGLLDSCRELAPDVVVMDARMPPTHTDEGIRAALELRLAQPTIGALILSTYADGSWARQLFAAGSTGLGYLLKDRVDDTADLIDAIHRVASGGTAVDPEVIQRLLEITGRRSPLATLSEREREVLALMAQGRSNNGIGAALHLSPRTVEAYIASIFAKLPLDADDSATNRRVLSVLTYLEQARS